MYPNRSKPKSISMISILHIAVDVLITMLSNEYNTFVNTKAQYTWSSNNCQIFYSRSNDLLRNAHPEFVIFINLFVIYIQFVI